MKSNPIVFLLALVMSVSAKELPRAGKTYTIEYDAMSKGILAGATHIRVVYAFDYWGTQGIATRGPEDLFRNVLAPDSGRAHTEQMKRKGKGWIVEIKIPEHVSLLSYYFTDGQNNDYNDGKTYVEYIYNEQGKPVKNARFRNIDFLVMAGKSAQEQLDEIVKEIGDYPTNFIAYIPYWSLKFRVTNSYAFDSLLVFKNQALQKLSALEEKGMDRDSLRNFEAGIYYAESRAVSQILQNIYRELDAGQNQFMDIMTQIPEEKRDAILNTYYKKILESEKKRLEAESFLKEIIGKEAIDFDAETISGEKIKLSNFKGKYVLLDFWGTWCGPCLAEFPYLKKAYEKYKEKGFEIIGISSDAFVKQLNNDRLKNFALKNGMRWIQILDSIDQRIHKLYKINHWPSTFLIDQAGKVIKVEYDLRGEKLLTTLRELLGE